MEVDDDNVLEVEIIFVHVLDKLSIEDLDLLLLMKEKIHHHLFQLHMDQVLK
jgi:hypothetical protein